MAGDGAKQDRGHQSVAAGQRSHGVAALAYVADRKYPRFGHLQHQRRDRAALRIDEPALVEYLQQRVEHVVVGVAALVEAVIDEGGSIKHICADTALKKHVLGTAGATPRGRDRGPDQGACGVPEVGHLH
ncbi:MAG TPA: hypothetical protein VJT72_10920 [Pseudonocardiaceae bacterium]|nr:hypothetical protein [Pseudonocardiaceae bacterium]